MNEQASRERFAKVLQDALDRPIAFHRVFVKLTGSVTAALMLSQAVYWSKRANSNDEGWFYKTRDQWEEETGLSRYEQESAPKALRRLSFWKEDLRGVPAQMHYRVDITSLSSKLLLVAESLADKPHINARLLESSQLDGGKPADKTAVKQPACLREISQPYKGLSETTTEITTTPLTPLEQTPDQPGGGRDFVEKLLAGTMLQGADPGRISKAAAKYRRRGDEIAKAIDVLDQQYRQSTRKVDDPTALIVCALKDGLDPPEGYVPRSQREAEAEQRRESARRKADEERRAKEAEEKAYTRSLALHDPARPMPSARSPAHPVRRRLPHSGRSFARLSPSRRTADIAALLPAPAHVAHPFRRMPPTCSEACRPLIPAACRPFL